MCMPMPINSCSYFTTVATIQHSPCNEELAMHGTDVAQVQDP